MPASEQLRFLPPARPLIERFGPDFFRALPKQPGVYVMHDDRGKIIYIGKARNLRARVSSYKYLKPGRDSRKSIRLVHTVDKILCETCESDLAAQLRENFLLRTHRPKFNKANVYPKAYLFIAFTYENGHLDLHLTRDEGVGQHLFGAFKGQVLFAFPALLRAIWIVSRQFSWEAFPSGFFGERIRRHCSLSIEEGVANLVFDFLRGASADFVNELQGKFDALTELSPFERELFAQDQELLRNFFEKATSQNKALRERFKVETRVIPQEQLNDLLLRARLG